eukprot:5533608-Lingulodinium_polyedra.AAC.1
MAHGSLEHSLVNTRRTKPTGSPNRNAKHTKCPTKQSTGTRGNINVLKIVLAELAPAMRGPRPRGLLPVHGGLHLHGDV